MARLKRNKERREIAESSIVVEDAMDISHSTTRDIGINTDFFGGHYDNLAAENDSLRKRLEKSEKIISILEAKVKELETVNQQYIGQIVVQNLNHQILRKNSEKTERRFRFRKKSEKIISILEAKVKELETVNQQYISQIVVQNMNHQILMNEDQLKFYTGLPNKVVFNELLNACLNAWKPSTKMHLEPSHQFLMVLMRLQLGLLIEDLATRFSISISTTSKLVHEWLHIMYELFQVFLKWPSKKCVRRNLPESFANVTFQNVRGIIDCTEVFIEKPSSLNARAQTYSSYKGHNTVKFLVVSTPSGGISFVSQAWGGRATDRQITQECGVLDLVEPDDLYLVDRGFNCEDLFASRGAKILIPSFTKGKSQLSGEEVALSRKYSRVRIHVERRIERLKNYRILSNTIPISILKRPSDVGNVCTIDKILVLCAALTNIQRPIIKISR